MCCCWISLYTHAMLIYAQNLHLMNPGRLNSEGLTHCSSLKDTFKDGLLSNLILRVVKYSTVMWYQQNWVNLCNSNVSSSGLLHTRQELSNSIHSSGRGGVSVTARKQVGLSIILLIKPWIKYVTDQQVGHVFIGFYLPFKLLQAKKRQKPCSATLRAVSARPHFKFPSSGGEQTNSIKISLYFRMDLNITHGCDFKVKGLETWTSRPVTIRSLKQSSYWIPTLNRTVGPVRGANFSRK